MYRTIISFCLLIGVGLGSNALQLEISQGNIEPIPLALVPFSGGDSQAQAMAHKMGGIIQGDLESTGLFRFISPQAFIQSAIPIDLPPRFSDWRLLKAQGVLVGEVSFPTADTIKIRFRLWDIFSEESLIVASYETEKKYWRRLAHLIADSIYKRLTGEEGYFDTRIVYITEEAQGLKQKKRLAIMDQDGANHKYLSDGRFIVLTPRFSPNLQKITYLSYQNKVPKVFILDLETGREELVGAFPGMTFAPRFSPDGKAIIMSQALHGNSDIYVMNLNTREVKRLTKGSNIDTSPCYDPTGKQIVFNSDRGGSKQLYIMDADGKNVRRISFGGGVYSTPVWSPRGDYIAFTKTQAGKFYIGIMKPDGSAERLLATGFIVEGPTWAPNGRTLIYTQQEPSTKKERGFSRLHAIDSTGYNDRIVQTPHLASDPAWSPLLPTA